MLKQNYSKNIFLLPCFFIGILLFNHANAENTPPMTYSFYVVPQLSPLATYKAWTPILDKLETVTGLTFELHVEPDIPSFEQALENGIPDFAFMNPYHAVVAKHHKGYMPLLRDSAQMLEGIVVVKNNALVKSLEDLKEKTIAFPAPNAFAASILIRSILENKNISIIPSFVKTHSNVYRSVVMGDALAGGGIKTSFNMEPSDVREQLRILYTTPQYAPHPIAVNPHVPLDVRDKLITAWIKLANDPENTQLFSEIQMLKPILADYERDYQPLEKLKLKSSVVLGIK